jgi:hypothetical protein
MIDHYGSICTSLMITDFDDFFISVHADLLPNFYIKMILGDKFSSHIYTK